MLNSAASTLVSNYTSEMANGKKDSPTVQTLKLQYGTSTEEPENLNSQFASLKVRDEQRMMRPQSDQMTAVTAPELKETKHSAETGNDLSKAVNRERNKRSLPSTPRSLYGVPSSPTKKITGSENTRRSSTSSTISNSVNNAGFVPGNRSFIEDASKSSQLKQTHIAVYKFIARHDDETSLDNGDPVRVTKRCEDLWFEGINMRTGRSGIFPSRYVSDILQEDFGDEAANGMQESQFSVSFLGSVEVFGFKGNDILCDAIKQIVKQHQLSSAPKPPACILDVSSKGIKIIEHLQTSERQGSVSSKRSSKRKIGKLFDKDSKAPVKQCHFFALKNVTFCGCHPNNARFFAFITKHPEEQRFACHVFMSEFSTEPVANAVGRAFNEFYAEFLDYQAPVEDFYIE